MRTVYASPQQLMISPSRVAWHTASFLGYIPVTTAATAYFLVEGNQIYQPFNTGQPITTSGGVTAVGSSGVTLQFLGYTQMAALYGAYRTRRSRITVQFTPNVSGDDLLLTVYPVNTGSGTDSLTASYAESQPYCKTRMVTNANNVKMNTIVSEMDSARLSGLTRLQYDCAPFNGVAATSGIYYSWVWAINWQCFDGTSNSNNIYVNVKIEQEVEWAQPKSLTN
jgi:hypothetical protein